MISMNINGMPNLQQALAACDQLARGNQLVILLENEIEAATLMLRTAATKRAPVKERTLRGEADSKVQLTGTKPQATVTFGGQAADYASVQHEREDFVHPKGGQAHYLYGTSESAWESNEAAFARLLDAEAGRLADAWLQKQI